MKTAESQNSQVDRFYIYIYIYVYIYIMFDFVAMKKTKLSSQ